MRLVLAFALLAGCAHGRATPHDEPAHVGTEPTPVRIEPAPAPRSTSKEPPAPPRQSTGTITRAELVAVLDAAPGRFLQHVDTEPRFQGGHFHGWRLASFYPGDERFARVDLLPGDVVLTVNGLPIEQPDQLMRVWELLRTQRSLTVQLERDGQPRELRYDIRD